MTGMKEGAGDDPFAEDPEEEKANESSKPDRRVVETSSRSAGQADDQAESGSDSMDIPYKFRRDGVMEGRSQMPVYIREEIQEQEADFIRELEELLGESVPKADAREAAFVVAHQNPEQVAAVLRSWGFDYE